MTWPTWSPLPSSSWLRVAGPPPLFCPNLTEKYDGSINPSEFLQIYTTIIVAAGGDDRVMANYFPMALKGQARGWLMTQPPDSIHSWEDLCQQFITNFQGTYPRPGEEADLHAVQRKDDESLRSYIQCFCQVRNTILCISAHEVVYAFWNGVRHNRMLEKIASKKLKTTAELFELADKVAWKEEAWAWNSPGTGAVATAAPESIPRSKRRERRGERKPARSDDVGHIRAAEGPSWATRKEKAADNKPCSTTPSGEGRSADKWCSVHNTYRHSLADCRSVKNLAERFRKADEKKRQSRWEGKAPATPANDWRELLATVPTHEPARKAHWSEVKLTFDQSDHPTVLARGGKLALVVSPTIHNVKMKRVLVDGGASLSIISPAAFDALKAPGMKLQPSLPIISVTPGHTWPLGHVELSVTFGDSTNFRTERIDFDVVDLNLPYNAVLGRPALVKFMAATHYAYLQMKMSGPSVPITVFGDVKKVRCQAPERQAFIREEVTWLLEAGFIREVIHPEWLANPVVVPKANGKLRMCIDYTNLNKACPKDPFPLPRIDQIVDSTAGCDLLSFLDAYSGYHQIRMAREDEEKTAFITHVCTFCYTTMPFGLKNACPTFRRMTRITLSNQIGHNVEAYVDDLVVKTRHQDTLLQDLAETFDSLRSTRNRENMHNMRLRSTSKLLGFLISSRGIEANPKKIRAIERMRPPSKLRDVQCVTGCMAALSRFISRLGERALPLFKLLKRPGPFVWMKEAELPNPWNIEHLRRFYP
uniref:Gag-pol polyprotein n=2 Tax=Oryza sativa subsp. japonica TaxID=39947 RepID=Q851H1_ORYSJ|nr:putative gag-pol polyprotein [Oryza sativa Japonica Group]